MIAKHGDGCLVLTDRIYSIMIIVGCGLRDVFISGWFCDFTFHFCFLIIAVPRMSSTVLLHCKDSKEYLILMITFLSIQHFKEKKQERRSGGPSV